MSDIPEDLPGGEAAADSETDEIPEEYEEDFEDDSVINLLYSASEMSYNICGYNGLTSNYSMLFLLCKLQYK